MTNYIDEGSLPRVSPAPTAHLRAVQGGKSVLVPMPDVANASALVAEAIDGVVQTGRARANAEVNRVALEAAEAIASVQSGAAAILSGLGYLPPVEFEAGLSVESSRFTVDYDGETYAAAATAIPFTTTNTFNPSQWRLIRGVTSADLAVSTGAALVGTASGLTVEQRLTSLDRVTGEMYAPVSVTGFDNNGVLYGSWNAKTYASWISGIDAHFAAEISAGSMVKSDLGPSSNPSLNVYSYSFGNGLHPVLLVGGTHGEETVAQYSLVRFVEWFMRSDHAAARLLRGSCRIVWIPTLNAASYRVQRQNANGVDLNRNYDFHWQSFKVTNPMYPKGAAPFSEPETQMVRDLCAALAPCMFLDCHNYGAGEFPHAMMWAPPSSWTLGKRDLVLSAARRWQSIYGYSWAEINEPQVSYPQAMSWASHYQLHVIGDASSGASAMLEMDGGFAGSNGNTVTPEAASVYCGAISTTLLEWLQNGQKPVVGYPIHWRAWNPTARNTSINDGGTLLDMGDLQWKELKWTAVAPNFSGNTSLRTGVNIIAPCGGVLEVSADGYVLNNGVNTQRFGVRINLFSPQFNTDPETYLTTSEFDASLAYVETAPGENVPFATSLAIPINPGVRRQVRLEFARVNVSSPSTLDIRRARMMVRFIPANSVCNVVPGVN